MHIIALTDKAHYDYLLYVFEKHVTGGLSEADELAVAAQVWQQIKNARELDPAALTGKPEPEVIKIPGPLSIAHNGDLNVPKPAVEYADDDRIATGS